MFTITEKLALLYKKVKFLTSPNPNRHYRLLLIFLRMNSAWYNVKSHGRLFFKKMFCSLDIEKVEKSMVAAYKHLFRSRFQLYSSILGFY